ncbi:MAG: integrating conjugative element protein [Gammaproteobacteria bacterium]|nr:integrating conjugative element protein [Gammaproteobacteria bacterium]
MRCPATKLPLSVLAGLIPLTALAAPEVIHDSGQTRPLAPYLESLRGEDPPPDRRHRPSGQAGLTAEELLPIETPGMSPGPVQPRALDLPDGAPKAAMGARPLFLIGADPLSRRWLANHRDRLAAIGAVGMLVDAKTKADLRTIARLARGLRIMPAPATEIAKLYNLKRYPVLIWRGHIEQ